MAYTAPMDVIEHNREAWTKEPLEYDHSLESQIGGQVSAGGDLLDPYIETFIATLAFKER
jgi:hypothetical protein